jgi:hypothetical protein
MSGNHRARQRLLNERGEIACPYDIVATYGDFGGLLAEPTTQASAARFLAGGLHQRSEFELNLRSHLQKRRTQTVS